jgi:uncharacterized OB-fold protein
MYKNSPILRWRRYDEQYCLIGNRCSSCSAIYYPKKKLCKCSAKDFEDFQLSGNGTLLSYTEIRSAPEEYKNQVPYCLGIIQLEECPRIIAQITDCTVNELKIGAKVKAVFRRFYKINEEGIIHYGIKFCLLSETETNLTLNSEVSKH